MDGMNVFGTILNNFFDTMLFLIFGFLEQATAILLFGFNSLLP